MKRAHSPDDNKDEKATHHLNEIIIKQYNSISNKAFAFATVVCVLAMSFGFLTFGGSADGNILNSYASSDSIIAASRVAVAVALLTSFPFNFIALRDGK